MLRLLIITGSLLMLVGFGAAGWQYLRGPLPGETGPTAAMDASENLGQQSWLISSSGGIVRRADVQAFLEQGRFVADRKVDVIQVASLASLLAAGEKLPDTPYLEVLADIRAPMIAEALCPALTGTVAKACAVQSARVVKGSVDPVMGTARFQIALVYHQTTAGAPLPDLAAHVLRTEAITPFATAPSGDEPAEPAEPAAEAAKAPVLPSSGETALAEVLQSVVNSCAAEDRVATCRLLRLSLDWAPGVMPEARAEIGWLAPLPDGMTAAPPLEPPPEG
jgi:hypothetical protein